MIRVRGSVPIHELELRQRARDFLQGRDDAPEYTPAPGAKDPKSVLFNWAWHMGMLRSTEEYDLIMSLAYEGTGTIQVDGQPYNVGSGPLALDSVAADVR
jgi:hypothetical protein